MGRLKEKSCNNLKINKEAFAESQWIKPLAS